MVLSLYISVKIDWRAILGCTHIWAYDCWDSPLYPSILFACPYQSSRGATPANIGREVGYILGRANTERQTTIHTYGQFTVTS